MLSRIDREHNSGGETKAVRRQTTSGVNPAGSSRVERLDPLSLPATARLPAGTPNVGGFPVIDEKETFDQS